MKSSFVFPSIYLENTFVNIFSDVSKGFKGVRNIFTISNLASSIINRTKANFPPISKLFPYMYFCMWHSLVHSFSKVICVNRENSKEKKIIRIVMFNVLINYVHWQSVPLIVHLVLKFIGNQQQSVLYRISWMMDELSSFHFFIK